MTTISKDQAVQLAREAGWIIHDDLCHEDRIQVQNALLERVERLIKLGRNAGLEEAAKRFRGLNGTEWFAENVAEEIESLKD